MGARVGLEPAAVVRAPTNRLNFANQLRGLAALLVAASHLIGVFWAMRPFVAAATFSPAQPGSLPALYKLISFKWFELGPFGVAVFFLISGLVIPFSLRHHTRRTFLLARVLRIYPTFVLALMLEMLLLYAMSHYWHTSFSYTPRTILFQCLLVSNLAGTPVIDFVSWTLSVEMKFYLLVTLIAPAIRSGRTSVILSIATALAAAVIVLSRIIPVAGAAPVLLSVCNEITYIVFMMIGVLFYFHHAGYCSSRLFCGSVALLSLAFLAAWRFGVLRPEYPIVIVNYFYALALFAGLYAWRHHIPNIRVLSAMSSISYPFYLIHPILGFTVMKLAIISWHLGYGIALCLAVLTVAVVASALHVTVERWTIRLGRQIGGNRPMPG